MLPEKLVIEAFGPYLTQQTVDFTRFADKFLIWGETGAGKTVLLDAMTAALYNRASAEERGDMESMRCQMAEPERDSYVEFTFSVRGRRVRFWKRLKTIKRRKADAEEKYKLECGALEILDGGAERSLMQNEKAREQERIAEEIVGMGYHQFVQVMVLPQGKFERFLTADSAEKEKILKNIFRTDRYNAYQESLNRSYRAFDAQVHEQEQAQSVQLKMYGAESAQELREQLVQDIGALDALQRENEEKKRCYEVHNAQAAAARQLEERFLRWERSGEALRALQARGEEMQRCEQAVERAERARVVQPVAAEYRRLTQEQEHARAEQAQAEQEKQCAAAEREAAAQELAACLEQREQTEQMKDELTQAEQRLPELAALDAAVRAENEARQLYEPAEKRVETLRENVQSESEVLHRNREEMRTLETRYRAKLPELQALCEKYAQAGRCAQQVDALSRQLNEARSTEAATRLARDGVNERACQAMQEEAERQNQYFSNAAAELAKRLEEGKPCPVCGSMHHPNVHQSRAYADARQQLQWAIRQLKQVREELTNAAARCEGAQERVRSLQDQLNNAKAETAAQIPYDAQAEKAAQTALAQAQEGVKRCDALQKEVQLREQQLVRQENELQKAQETLRQRQEALTQTRTRVQERKKRVGNSAQSAVQLQQRIAELRGSIAEQEQREQRAVRREHDADTQLQLRHTLLETAQKRLAQLETQRAEAGRVLKETLAAQGFADEADYRTSALEEAEIVALRAQVQAYYQQFAAAKSESEAAYQGVEGQQRPDLAATLSAREQSLAAVNDTAMRLGTQEALVQSKTALLQRTEREGGKLEQQKRTRDKMRAFAESFTYAKGVTLSSFVLSAMLSSVAEQANQLLTLVHGGRYRLSIKKASTRARLDGLELAVQDAYTGQERDVRTLSGGEKFLVSLSLSLGLSAVVRAQAGGISMEAMFIDEGFGTLDPRSIKDALDVLMRIGTGSRVGIISHVDVLRENILQGIEVVKNDKGSTLVMRT